MKLVGGALAQGQSSPNRSRKGAAQLKRKAAHLIFVLVSANRSRKGAAQLKRWWR